MEKYLIYVPIPYKLNPYPYQLDALRAVIAGKNAFIVIHRRAGKDIICLQMLLIRALQRVGTHLYLAPMQTQIRQIIWKGMDFDGKPFLSAIPDCLIRKKNDARMEIELFNGSRIVFGGSNNISGIIGTNPCTIIYSEFSLHNPVVRQYLNPILIQNLGVEILNCTPRGRNHAFEVFEAVRENPKYFIQHLGVEQTFRHDGTRVISEQQIQEAAARGMSKEMIDQEFFCSFDAANVGSYFSREMSDIDKEGRIMLLKPDPSLPLHTCSDLGGTDSTAMLLFQVVGKYIHVLALIHDSGKGLKYYLEEAEKYRQSFMCNWGNHFMPHDSDQKMQGWEHAESRLMQARKNGWFFQMVPKVAFEDGLESLRYLLPRVRLDKARCSLAIRALREYQRVWDDEKACFAPKPLDNWAVHIADAFRYLGVQYKRLYDVPMQQSTYSTSM